MANDQRYLTDHDYTKNFLNWAFKVYHNDYCFRENAAEMIIELLRTYPVESGLEAKDDTIKCIVSFIDRPHVWIMDHLLELGPVKCLKGELIYQVGWLESPLRVVFPGHFSILVLHCFYMPLMF